MSHYDDEQQAEVLQTWLKENWIALLAGLGIGLGAIFGWQGWKHTQERQAAAASRLYEELRQAVEDDKLDAAGDLLAKLDDDYSGSPYRVHALMLLARHEVEQGQLDAAAGKLRSVVDSDADAPLKQVARLRLARVLWAQDKDEAALQQLDAGGAGEFAALFEQLRGDIRLAQGDRKAAREAYQRALEAGTEDAPDRELLQQKFDDLADVVLS